MAEITVTEDVVIDEEHPLEGDVHAVEGHPDMLPEEKEELINKGSE